MELYIQDTEKNQKEGEHGNELGKIRKEIKVVGQILYKD